MPNNIIELHTHAPHIPPMQASVTRHSRLEALVAGTLEEPYFELRWFDKQDNRPMSICTRDPNRIKRQMMSLADQKKPAMLFWDNRKIGGVARQSCLNGDEHWRAIIADEILEGKSWQHLKSVS
jgi:hypothetical protein